MSERFEDALGGMARRAARAHEASGGLPVPALARRVRRARRRDAVVATTAAAAVVVGVAVTATALVDRPAPPPPAGTSTPTPEPTPSPTRSPAPTPTPSPTSDGPAPTVLPVGDASLPFGECASVDGSPTAHPLVNQTEEWRPVEASVESTALIAGDPLRVRSRVQELTYVEPSDGLLVPAGGPSFVVTRDGVVVAVGSAFEEAGDELLFLDTPSISFDGVLPLAVCAAVPGTSDVPATPGRALPAGDYVLHAVVDLVVLPPVDGGWPARGLTDGNAAGDLAGADDGEWFSAVSDPVAFTVSGDALDPLPRPTSDVEVGAITATEPPWCGQPAPGRTDGDLFVVETGAPPTAVRAGEEWDLDVALRYVGPGRVRGVMEGFLAAWVVQDGVVVGASLPWSTDQWWAPMEMGTGASRPTVSRHAPFTGCPAEDGTLPEALPPGTYTVHPTVTPTVRQVTTRGTTVEAPDGGVRRTVVGEPFELVIE
ncbi:hypothetical protein Q9R32_00395 [Actinotalea sp. AC32]|nr:hypothetical protein [Actinotalea sp. AC32]